MILLTKVHIAKAMIFPVFMYRCSCTDVHVQMCRELDYKEG